MGEVCGGCGSVSRYRRRCSCGIQSDTINIQISGSLDLSSGGQSVNIINELQNNPILLRALSRMLSEHLSNALNGGRGSLPISISNV